MKKILILCAAATVIAACNKNDKPEYGSHADVSTASEAQDAINQGSVEIFITEPLTADANFTIPKGYSTDGAIMITMDAAGKSITVSEGSGSNNYPALVINVLRADDVTIDTPHMSVLFEGGVSGTLTDSASTLTVGPGSDIYRLAVENGDVRMFGTVTTLGAVAPASRILYSVSTAAELHTRMTVTPYDHGTNGGVILADDIEYVVPADTNIDGTPAISGAQANQDAFRLGAAPTDPQPAIPYNGYIIDGNGHSLSGAAYNNVLAVYADNVTVKDLTVIQTADQKANRIVKSGAAAPADNAGISLYRVTGAVLTDVTTRDCGKYGIILNGSEATATDITSGSNNQGGINIVKGSGVTETPKLDLVSASITDRFAVVVNASASDAVVSVPSGWTSVTEAGVTVYSPPAK